MCQNYYKMSDHRDGVYTERECLAVFTFARLGCLLNQQNYFYFFTIQNLVAVADSVTRSGDLLDFGQLF